jgi:hypothetical protein
MSRKHRDLIWSVGLALLAVGLALLVTASSLVAR